MIGEAIERISRHYRRGDRERFRENYPKSYAMILEYEGTLDPGPQETARYLRRWYEFFWRLRPKTFVERMTIAEFEKAGLAVKVASDVLGENVWFASYGNPGKRPDGAVVYTAEELYVMAVKTAEELIVIHQVKKFFPGARVERCKVNKNLPAVCIEEDRHS